MGAAIKAYLEANPDSLNEMMERMRDDLLE